MAHTCFFLTYIYIYIYIYKLLSQASRQSKLQQDCTRATVPVHTVWHRWEYFLQYTNNRARVIRVLLMCINQRRNICVRAMKRFIMLRGHHTGLQTLEPAPEYFPASHCTHTQRYCTSTKKFWASEALHLQLLHIYIYICRGHTVKHEVSDVAPTVVEYLPDPHCSSIMVMRSASSKVSQQRERERERERGQIALAGSFSDHELYIWLTTTHGEVCACMYVSKQGSGGMIHVPQCMLQSLQRTSIQQDTGSTAGASVCWYICK